MGGPAFRHPAQNLSEAEATFSLSITNHAAFSFRVWKCFMFHALFNVSRAVFGFAAALCRLPPRLRCALLQPYLAGWGGLSTRRSSARGAEEGGLRCLGPGHPQGTPPTTSRGRPRHTGGTSAPSLAYPH